MSTHRVSMQDIAQALGVSKASVSRAFHHDPKCGPELRARVFAKAEAMGYQPDPFQQVHMARMRGSVRAADREVTLALLDLNEKDDSISVNPSNRRFLQGAQQRALELGAKLECFRPQDSGMSLSRQRAVWRARGIRGVILGPMPQADTHLEIDLSGFAAVAIGYTLASPNMHRVSHNHYSTTLEVMHVLREKGYRRVGMAIDEAIQARVNQRWHAAYYEFARVHPEMAQVESLRFQGDISDALEAISDWAQGHQLDAVLGNDPRIINAFNPDLSAAARPLFVDMDYYPEKSPQRDVWVDQDFETIAASAVDEIFALWGRGESGLPKKAKNILLDGTLHGFEVTLTPSAPAC